MKKIVLIEDDADLFALLKYNLEKEGFQLAGSQTGKGAIELCRRERPDLILLDLNLPGISGLDVLASIKADQRLAAIPVVVFTSSFLDQDRKKSFALGAQQYITKPDTFDGVVQALTQLPQVKAARKNLRAENGFEGG